MSALSAPSWCVLSLLCNTTHVKTMSPITFGLCSIVPSKTLNLLAGFQMHSPISSCLWRSCSLLFSLPLWVIFCCRVSQTMESRKRHRHPARNCAKLALPVQRGSGGESPKLPSSIIFLNLLQLKICASDGDHLAPHWPRGICIWCWTGLAAPGKRSPSSCTITPRFHLLLYGNLFSIWCTKNKGDIPSGSKHLYIFQSSGSVGHVKYSSWNSARMAQQTIGTNLHMVVWPTSQ